jgi:excisionase family DNA binding protein
VINCDPSADSTRLENKPLLCQSLRALFGALHFDEVKSVADILLTPEEASKVLKFSERTLWGLTNDGKIPHVRIGRLIRYRPAALEEWARSQETSATPSQSKAAAV